ncbi:MAG: glycoside hydrolase family 30 protein [Ginsengibacter sp.]
MINTIKCSGLVFLGVFVGCLSNYSFAQKAPSANGVVQVYSSSQEGDRLLRKQDIQFAQLSSLPENSIKVDDQSTYQKIDGFGATFNEAGMICLNSLSKEGQNKVLKSLFDTVEGVGYTLMKSPIAACDFASAEGWYNYDSVRNDTLMQKFSIERDKGPNGLITFIKAAKEKGSFRIESPMDFAPDWMYFGLKPGKKHIKPEYYQALSRYYSKYLSMYKAAGVNIDYLDLFNEADNSWYSNETYAEVGQLIKGYVAPRLKADGLDTKIQFGESSSRPEGIEKFPPGLDIPGVQEEVNSLTVHGYDWNNFSSLTALHEKYPSLPIWMTEVCYAYSPTVNNIPPGGPTKMPVYGFNDGEFWGNMIVNDMKHWVSGWIYWNMILDENGGPWLISVKHGDPVENPQHPVVIINRKTNEVTYTGLYYYLGHFSKFVRPGAYRIDCSGSNNSNFNYVGFKNTDGSIILNIINNGSSDICRVKWKNEVFSQKLEGHSITTFIWRN